MKKIILISIVLLVLNFVTACSSFQPESLAYDGYETNFKNKVMKYGVYTPPNWTPKEKLPLVLFLHGGGDNHTSFEKFRAHEEFDRRINSGDMPRVILVTPDGDLSLWENWADGKRQYRDWVMRGVLPKVKADYNTLDCPENCHLMGISMGGYGVMKFAYFEPNQFSSVSAISASIYSDDQIESYKGNFFTQLIFPIKKIFGPNAEQRNQVENVFRTWPKLPHLRNTRLQLIWGADDLSRIKIANERFSQMMKEAGVEPETYVFAGNHKWVAWKPQLSRAINFLLSNQNR